MRDNDPREDIVWRLRDLLKAKEIDREKAYQILILFDKGVEKGQNKEELYKVADEEIKSLTTKGEK
jgi:hypothetical protein|tara:strand:+ start:1130 stop:1327 length:198 start_codon:yes stop_codon:yes gene_type:complete